MLGIINRTFLKKKLVCVIHEVEVNTLKKDNLSLYLLQCLLVFLGLAYYRTTVGSIMLMNLFIIVHSN